MSEIYELTAEIRSAIGKASSRRLRRLDNKVPGIVYGGDQQPKTISIDHNILANALENEGFYSHILTLAIDGHKEKVVLKDLHRHPSKPKVLHADFLRINPNTKITMHVPLHFVGAELAPGVKNEGGVISHLLSDIEIRCLPKDLPEFIEIDVSKLSIGDAIHLSELKLPSGVEILALVQGEPADQPVVSIHRPTVVEEESASVAAQNLPESDIEEPQAPSED